MPLWVDLGQAAYRSGKCLVRICCLMTALSFLPCGTSARCAGNSDGISASAGTAPPVYTIQVGAFSRPDRAVQFVERLHLARVNAVVSSPDNRLHRVRFGAFPSRDQAKQEALRLAAAGIIHEYLIVKMLPSPVSPARPADPSIREKIVETAYRFIDLPYSRGNASRQVGFDCSGLTMAVYRVIGLSLPRSSLAQWTKGKPVKRNAMQAGDLVFFATEGKGHVSHVGIYMGGGNFAHAPGKGKKIRIDSLSNDYFKSTFAGARTYL